jgi:S1-C subfamily serine protease
MDVERSTALPRRSAIHRIMIGAVACAVVAACGPDSSADRAVALEVEGCGHAFATSGSGVAVDRGLVVTVAHLIVQADGVRVRTAAGVQEASVLVVDRRSDLALVGLGSIDASPVHLRDAAAGEVVTIVGGRASGDVPATVRRTLDIRIEEVLGTERVLRRGLELRADASVGDSGAGVFGHDGDLLGIVFAVASDGSDTTWATSASEISVLLDARRGTWGCDPSRSELVRTDQP